MIFGIKRHFPSCRRPSSQGFSEALQNHLSCAAPLPTTQAAISRATDLGRQISGGDFQVLRLKPGECKTAAKPPNKSANQFGKMKQGQKGRNHSLSGRERNREMATWQIHDVVGFRFSQWLPETLGQYYALKFPCPPPLSSTSGTEAVGSLSDGSVTSASVQSGMELRYGEVSILVVGCTSCS